MRILFVSECEKAAQEKTRRVLDKYAHQFGRRCWSAWLSAEGLDEVRSELAAVASRHTAVQALRIRHDGRMEVLWQMGNRKHFDRDGRYAFSWTQRDILQSDDEGIRPEDRLARAVLDIAALVHDAGKGSTFFQELLKSNSGTRRSPIRHEIVSLLIWDALCNSDVPFETLDITATRRRVEDYFSRLDPKSAVHHVEAKLLSGIRHGLADPASGSNRKWAEAMVGWLIATHHKALNLGGVNALSVQRREPWEGNYFAFDDRDLEDPERIEAMSRTLDVCTDWMAEHGYLDRLSERVSQLVGILQLDPDRWAQKDRRLALQRMMAGAWRPLFIVGDYIGSAEPDPLETETGIYAKSDDGNDLGQSLVGHLFDVESAVNRVHDGFVNGRWRDRLPAVDRRSEALTVRPANARFIWQFDAAEKLEKADCEGMDGFFGVCVAQTGSGKSIAGAKMMAGLRGGKSFRYTLGLGFRSLTLQTADEYVRPIPTADDAEAALFEPEQVTTMVGDRGSRLMHEAEKDAEETDESTGNRDEFRDALVGYDVEGAQGFADLPEVFESLGRDDPRQRDFQSAPVLVCTVDHLVDAARLDRGSHSLAALRLMTGDLLLDEIDAYSDEDLVTVAKLVYLTGLFGNRVMVMSATLNPIHYTTLHDAYLKGLSAHCQTRGIDRPRVGFGFVSDRAEHTRVKVLDKHPADLVDRRWGASESARSLGEYRRFIDKVCADLRSESIRRRATVCPVPARTETTGYFDAVWSALRRMHDHPENHVEIEGVRVSFSTARFNNVGRAIGFARYLLDRPEESDTVFRIACYHARMLGIDRFIIEDFLKTHLQRKSGQPNWIIAPAIRSAIDEARERDIRNVLLVVSSTSIQETGRDYDYDFVVTEPYGTRSLNQMAGRVRRHRFNPVEHPNIGVMAYTHRYAVKGRERRADAPAINLEYPGVETPQFKRDRNNDFRLRYRVRDALSDRDPKDRAVQAALTRLGIEAGDAGNGPLFDAASMLSIHGERPVFSADSLSFPESLASEPLRAIESVRAFEVIEGRQTAKPETTGRRRARRRSGDGDETALFSGWLDSPLAWLHNRHAIDNPFRYSPRPRQTIYQLFEDGGFGAFGYVRDRRAPGSPYRKVEGMVREFEGVEHPERLLIDIAGQRDRRHSELCERLGLKPDGHWTAALLASLDTDVALAIPGESDLRQHRHYPIYHPDLGLFRESDVLIDDTEK